MMLILSIMLSFIASGQVSETTDPFQDALVASIHHFAEDGKLVHLQAILDKYPKLLDAERAQGFGKPTRGDGYTPLQTAARHGRDDVVAFLLTKGANINAADGQGYTPLHLAAEEGHLNVVKRLVRAGAKVDAKTKARPGGFLPGAPANVPAKKYDPIPARTALQIAEDQKHADVVKFLKAAKDK